MARHLLVLTTVTFALIFGAIGARAQEDSDDSAMMMQQRPGDEDGSSMLALHAAMHGARGHGPWAETRHDGARRYDETLRHAHDFRPYGSRRGRDYLLAGLPAAHENIFKAMDSDKDGTVSQEEMLDFMRGTAKSESQH